MLKPLPSQFLGHLWSKLIQICSGFKKGQVWKLISALQCRRQCNWSSRAVFLHIFFIFAWLRLVFFLHQPLLEGVFFVGEERVGGFIMTDEFGVAKFEQVDGFDGLLEGALLFLC